MIPYFPEPVFFIAGIPIHSFTLLLIAAFLSGIAIAQRKAARAGIDRDFMFSLILIAVTCGLVGAHIAELAMDYSAMFRANPSVIFTTSRGIRSIGAFFGGLAGACLYCRIRGRSFLESFRMLDAIAFTLPFAWMIGRLGCALAHDHRGLASTRWIAVRFPEGPRYDLGVIEFLFLIPLSAVFLWLDRRPRPAGFFFSLFACLYGGFRIWLDTLHLQPFRFYGGSLGMALGILGWIAVGRFRYTGIETESAERKARVRLGFSS